MPKVKVAIYGLTTEGYLLASRIIDKAAVTIIDETLQMAMELNTQIIKEHRDLDGLVGGEALMGLKPIPQVLGESKTIFFCPKLRRTSDESIIEANTKLRDVAKYVSKDTILVNGLPTGIGGNSDNIGMLEKQTGLKIGESLHYAYCPLLPRRGDPLFLATLGSPKEFETIGDLGLRPTGNNLTKSELEYVSTILAESVKIATLIELMRKAREQNLESLKNEEKYVDELASYVYDLTAIQASEDVGEPITYLASAAVKSLENYVRYLVDHTRELLRELQLKASKTRVVLAWTLDKYEMRADRMRTAESMIDRLRDYVTDVEHVQRSGANQAPEILSPYKYNIAIACSSSDYEWIKEVRRSNRGSEIAVLKATTALRHE